MMAQPSGSIVSGGAATPLMVGSASTSTPLSSQLSVQPSAVPHPPGAALPLAPQQSGVVQLAGTGKPASVAGPAAPHPSSAPPAPLAQPHGISMIQSQPHLKLPHLSAGPLPGQVGTMLNLGGATQPLPTFHQGYQPAPITGGVGVGQLLLRLAHFNEYQLQRPPNPTPTSLGGAIGGALFSSSTPSSTSTDTTQSDGIQLNQGAGTADNNSSLDSSSPTKPPTDTSKVLPTQSQFQPSSDAVTDFWRGFVNEFFCEGAAYRFIVQHRVFEVGAESLPRLFEATYSGGITHQSVEVLEPREYGIDNKTYLLTSRTACIRLESPEQIIELYGNLKVVFVSTPASYPATRPLSSLKILLWEFEKHGQKEFISPTMSPDKPRLATTDFGLPAVMRCFEIADLFQCMGDLIKYSIDNNCPPLESLRRYNAEVVARAQNKGVDLAQQPRASLGTPASLPGTPPPARSSTPKANEQQMELTSNGE